MPFRFVNLLGALLLAGGALSAQQVSPPAGNGAVPIEITADGENFVDAQTAVATGNVVVRYGDDALYADRVTYYRQLHEVLADGNVRLYSKGRVYRGRSAPL